MQYDKKNKQTGKQLLNGPLGVIVLNVEVIKDKIFMKPNPVQCIYSLWLVLVWIVSDRRSTQSSYFDKLSGSTE